MLLPDQGEKWADAGMFQSVPEILGGRNMENVYGDVERKDPLLGVGVRWIVYDHLLCDSKWLCVSVWYLNSSDSGVLVCSVCSILILSVSVYKVRVEMSW